MNSSHMHMATPMKTALVSLSLVSLLGVLPLGCSYGTESDAANELCTQMGWVYGDDPVTGEKVIIGNRFEFMPVGVDPLTYNNPTAVPKPATGTFEVNAAGQTFVGPGMLIADDDDLLDDYRVWQQAVALAQGRFNPENSTDAAVAHGHLAVYESMDPAKAEGEYTAEEDAAVQFVESVVAELLPYCSRINESRVTGVAPRPGDDLNNVYWPTFTACKDKYDAHGDGIVGAVDLLREGHTKNDAEMAACPGVVGPNQKALNVWGPLTTQEPEFEAWPEAVRDGFTYSGLTVPLESSEYKRTMDRGSWEGIAFWARVASADEAIGIGPNPAGLPPYAGDELPKDARAQDGVASVGIMVQTMDTAAVLNVRGEMDFMSSISVCPEGKTSADTFCFDTQAEFDAFPGMLVENSVPPAKWAHEDQSGFNADPSVPDGPGKPQTPEVPYCIDYSPVDTAPGSEVPFRDQCWDGFRTMVEVGPKWRFYFLPFSEMRQAGWGRVADRFRIDQVRSVNVLTSAYQPINIMIDEITFYRQR